MVEAHDRTGQQHKREPPVGRVLARVDPDALDVPSAPADFPAAIPTGGPSWSVPAGGPSLTYPGGAKSSKAMLSGSRKDSPEP
jgi:hypothetical protein